MNIENTAKAYELRNLTAEDIFPMFRIISKIGVKEFKSCFESDEVMKAIATSGEDGSANITTAVGLTVMMEVVNLLVDHLPDCKNDIYQFLANLSGMQKDEIAALPMMTFIEMIVDVIKKEEFKDFFRVVSKLFK